MSTDDLSTPLGQGKVRTRRKALIIPWPPVIAALLALPGCRARRRGDVRSNDPFGGEPMAIAPATVSTDAAAASDAAPRPEPRPPPHRPCRRPRRRTPAKTKTVTIIDGATGARREVVIPANAATAKAAAIKAPAISPAPPTTSA